MMSAGYSWGQTDQSNWIGIMVAIDYGEKR